jgi:hypothetical protein
MRVVGTGAPAALTLGMREHEIKDLSDELEHRRQVADDAMKLEIEQERTLTSTRDGGRSPTEFVAAIVAMQDAISRAQPTAEGWFVVTGPTWLLDPAIRSAAIDAVERLVDALRRFADEERRASEELRDAIRDASAWGYTLLRLDHAVNFGLDQ